MAYKIINLIILWAVYNILNRLRIFIYFYRFTNNFLLLIIIFYFYILYTHFHKFFFLLLFILNTTFFNLYWTILFYFIILLNLMLRCLNINIYLVIKLLDFLFFYIWRFLFNLIVIRNILLILIWIEIIKYFSNWFNFFLKNNFYFFQRLFHNFFFLK